MAVGTPVGSAFLDVQPQLGAGFQAAIASKINPVMGAVAGIAGGVLAGGVAAGFAAFKVGETFDEAFDAIRVGTGATGEELDALKEDFKGVFGSVPTDAATAGSAITDLNRRLGLTGGNLQDRAAQFLELSRITGTDLTANIEGVTRAFGDWGIGIDDQGRRLDELFRTGQATGIGVDQLAGSLVRFGAPLRQLGFDFQTSAALVGQFEKEGVNADLVLGSLRIALGKMAREGEPAQETLARVVDEIKNAGSTSEANLLALELFGARAGPDMAAAIREGRFEVAGLVDTIANGSDTIIGAGQETQDFAEKWEMFKNRVLVAIEPIATRVFEGIGNLIERIGPPIERWINGTLIPAIDAFAAWWDNNGPRIMEIAGTVFATIGDVIGRVVAVVQTVIAAFQSGEGEIGGAMENIKGIISGAVDIITNIVQRFQAFWAMFGDEIVALAVNAFKTIGGIISGVVQVIKGVIDVIAGVLTGDWKRVWEGFKTIFSGVWDAIKALVKGAIGQILIFFGDFITEARETVGRGVNQIVKFFQELPGRILNWLKELPGQMVQFGKDLVGGIISGIGNLGTQLFNSLKTQIGNAIQSAKNFFGIGSPSKFTAQVIGFPLAEGIVAGFTKALEPDSLLAATERAVTAITNAAGPTIDTSVGARGGIDGNLALSGMAAAQPTTVVISLDPDGKEKLAEFVVDWGNRRIRQINRAGG